MSCGRWREGELTGNVNDVWNVFLTIHRRDIGHCTPSDAIGISRNAYYADIRCRGKILDWIRPVSIPVTYAYMSFIPFNELPTAPQPVSPKLTITLCFKAAYICFESRAVDCWFG